MSLETFFSQDTNFDLAMKPFTWQHGVLVFLAIATIFLTLRYAEKVRDSKHIKKIKIGFAIWVISLEIIYHIHYWMHGMFSLPLHLCSLGAFLSVYLLLTDSKKAFQLLFLIGITGGLMALLIPDTLGYTYFNVRYYLFPLMHINIMMVPIFYFKAYKFRIDRKSIYITTIVILALMPIANIFNNAYDRNYLFIGREPRIFGDALPPYPFYLIIGAIGAFLFFNILYYIQFTDCKKIKRFFGFKPSKEESKI